MTRRRVTDEQYGQLWRRLEEVARRVDEGTIRFEPTMDDLQKLVVGNKRGSILTLTLNPSSSTVANEAKRRGLKLVNDSDQSLKAGEVELELCQVLHAGETRVDGDEMVRRAIKMGADKGEKHANAFLAQYKNWAPPKGVRYITFPGAVWQDGLGYPCVPYLAWDGDEWCLGFNWLGDGWNDGDRLLRHK